VARRKHTGKNRKRNISALQFFTDREEERSIIKRFFQSIMEPEQVIKKPILNFYGVGGAGKSSLVNKAIQEWTEESSSQRKAHKVALVDFDHSEAEKNYTIAHALWDIRSSLARTGILMYYFDALYAIYWAKTHGGQDSNLELSPLAKVFDFGLSRNEVVDDVMGGIENIIPESWTSAFGNLFDAAEEATTSVKSVVGGAKFLASLVNNKTIKKVAERLEFDPIVQIEDKSAEEIQIIMAEVFGIELAATLEKEDISLTLVIDGFERIHSNEKIEESIREFLIFASMDENDKATSRMGSIILGREKLKWRSSDGLESAHWTDLIEFHRLGGLAKEDAKAFINKAISFEKESGNQLIAKLLNEHADAILRACQESESASEDGYHPYYIDIAISMIRDRGEKFDVEIHLGASPAELQKRFLKYMNDKDKQFHLLLALALRFDWALINKIAEKNIVDTPKELGFESFIRHHSYVIEFIDRQDQYRLHRLMQGALIDCCDKKDARIILKALKDVFCQRLAGINILSDITVKQEEAYFHLMDIMFMALEEGFYSLDDFEQIEASLPVAFNEAYFSERIEYLQRLLTHKKNKFGERHFAVAITLKDLAAISYKQGRYVQSEQLYRESLQVLSDLLGDKYLFSDVLNALIHCMIEVTAVFSSQGRYREAEGIYRDLLAMQYDLFGDGHPDVAASLNSLAAVLGQQGKHEEAEEMYRESLSIRLEIFGNKHPDIANSLSNLATALCYQNKLEEAETVCRESLTMRRKLFGDNHPDVVASLNNLASILKDQGKFEDAENLVMQTN